MKSFCTMTGEPQHHSVFTDALVRGPAIYFAANETLRGMWVYHILTNFLFLMYSNPKMPKIKKIHAILRTAAHPGTGFVSLAIFELYKCSALSHTVVLLLFVRLYEAVKIK